MPRAWTLPAAAGTVNTGAATELCHVINAYDHVRDWGADVVHDQTLVGPVYAERFGLPVVTTNHGPFDLADLYRAVAARVARQSGIPVRIAAKMSEPTELAYFERDVAPLLGDGIDYVGEVGGRAKLELLAGARCLLNPIAWR